MDPDLDLELDLYEEVVSEWDRANDIDEDVDEAVEVALEEVSRDSARRAQASTLSALAQQMLAYPVITDPAEHHRLLELYLDGVKATITLSYRRKRSEARIDELNHVIALGNDAGNRLSASMFRLTRKIAMEQATNRYGRARAMAIMDDLIADANLALVESFTSYDKERCPRFALYAGKVIRTTITNRIQESSDNTHLTLPSSWLRTKRWAIPLINEVAAERRHDLSREEITEVLTAAAMDWAYERLSDEQKLLPAPEREVIMHGKLIKQGTIGAIRNWDLLMQQSTTATSLDASRGGEPGDRTLNDTLADTSSSDSTFDSAELSALRADLFAALDRFDERDKGIVLHRFGFIDDHCWTFAELEPRFNISAERVRQLEKEVLAALTGPDFAHLATYLPGREEQVVVKDDDEDTTPRTPPPQPQPPPSRFRRRRPRGP